MSKEQELPKFVKLGHSALRLRGQKRYFRDGGQWSVGFKTEKGKLISTSPMTWLNGVELEEITEEEWRIDNGQYAPKKL